MTTYPDHIFNWIDPTDANQVTWALGYLRKRGRASPARPGMTDHSAFEELMWGTQNWSLETGEYYKLIANMKGTWSKRKSRARQKTRELKKPYNFVLRTTREEDLGKLAKSYGLSKSKTLENIIGYYVNERRDLRKEIEQTIIDLKKKQAEQIAFIKRNPNRHLQQTKLHILELNNFLDVELLEHCRHLILMEDYGVTEEPLTAEQQERAFKKLEEKNQKRAKLKFSKHVYEKAKKEKDGKTSKQSKRSP